MSELTVTMLRLGLLVLLWLFVISTVGVLRRDIYGTRIVARQPRPAKRPNTRMPATPPGPPPTPQRQSPGRLVVVDGSMVGTTITLGGAPVLIGRNPECTLVLSDDYSSGRHLRLTNQGGQWIAEDLGSTNGTFIGRQQLTRPTPVEIGTQLRIGRTVLELRR